MKHILRRPRLVIALLALAALVGLAAVPRSQAPQTGAPGDLESRFTGQTSALDASALRATRRRFEAGARSAWHSHDGGQILFVQEGKGRVQRKGQPIKEMVPGDSDYTAPSVLHWHGAAPDQAVAQAAMSFGGETHWTEKVTDAEYLGTSAAGRGR